MKRFLAWMLTLALMLSAIPLVPAAFAEETPTLPGKGEIVAFGSYPKTMLTADDEAYGALNALSPESLEWTSYRYHHAGANSTWIPCSGKPLWKTI